MEERSLRPGTLLDNVHYLAKSGCRPAHRCGRANAMSDCGSCCRRGGGRSGLEVSHRRGLRTFGHAIVDLDDLALVIVVEFEKVGATMWPPLDPADLAPAARRASA